MCEIWRLGSGLLSNDAMNWLVSYNLKTAMHVHEKK